MSSRSTQTKNLQLALLIAIVILIAFLYYSYTSFTPPSRPPTSSSDASIPLSNTNIEQPNQIQGNSSSLQPAASFKPDELQQIPL